MPRWPLVALFFCVRAICTSHRSRVCTGQLGCGCHRSVPLTLSPGSAAQPGLSAGEVPLAGQQQSPARLLHRRHGCSTWGSLTAQRRLQGHVHDSDWGAVLTPVCLRLSVAAASSERQISTRSGDFEGCKLSRCVLGSSAAQSRTRNRPGTRSCIAHAEMLCLGAPRPEAAAQSCGQPQAGTDLAPSAACRRRRSLAGQASTGR